MSARVSYKKQVVVISMLVFSFLAVLEIGVNIWLYNFYQCDFEDNEIFKNLNSDLKRKICLESLEYDFTTQKVTCTTGTMPNNEPCGGLDRKVVNFNSLGFRSPEFSEEKPENTYRIFTVGGSATFGAGVFDNQTYPFQLQQIFDKSNLGFKVEVINSARTGMWSYDETELIKNKLLPLDPDLFIVYDGWNDAREERSGNPDTSAILWKQRWMEICELGNNLGFSTLITIQPLVGTGEKILTQQEYEKFIESQHQKLLKSYPSYVEQLEELKNQCSDVADLTSLFDDVNEPIFYDRGHTGEKGNQIIAKKLYQISLPVILGDAKNIFSNNDTQESNIIEIDKHLVSNDFDVF